MSLTRFFEGMPLLRETILLFALNLLDAVLTIIWVRNGIAGEGNQLMARLLEMGNLPFLTVKLAIGSLVAIVILSWGDLKVARYGLTFAIAVYLCLMSVHLVTGLSALGYISPSTVTELAAIPSQIFALIFRT